MVRVVVLGAAVLAIAGSAQASTVANAALNHLDNADLLDLLDADLDEDFLTRHFRNLQQGGETSAPTATPVDGVPTSAPTVGVPDGTTAAPSVAGSTSQPDDRQVDTDGAMALRPASAAMAVAAVVLAATAVMA